MMQQFVRTITLAQQQAILTPTILKLTITKNGYQYDQYQQNLSSNQGEWKPLQDALSRRSAFQNLFSVTVKIQNKKEILFFPSGDVTPFTVELKNKSQDFFIGVNSNGAVIENNAHHDEKTNAK